MLVLWIIISHCRALINIYVMDNEKKQAVSKSLNAAVELQNVIQSAMGRNVNPNNYKIFASRTIWEKGYSFTKEDLDNAERSENGFIGKQNGVLCYLSIKL